MTTSYSVWLSTSLPERDSDVMSGTFVGPIVPDKLVKFRAPHLNHSREIPPEVVGGRICDCRFRDNFQLEVAIDVIGGVGVE